MTASYKIKIGVIYMCLKISLNGMSREDWLKVRKTGIGGSDAGAVCGLNPYSSAMKVFRDKTWMILALMTMRLCDREGILRTT